MIKNFSATLQVDGKPVQFDFVTMNVSALHLFQVYCDWDGKRIRFHMQRGEGDRFVIKDLNFCSQEVQAIAAELSEAILHSQV